MQSIGMAEIFVVLVIALLVVGPRRLPEIARSLGKAWRTFQQETERATSALRESVDIEPGADPKTGVVDRPDGSPADAAAIPPPATSPVVPPPAASPPAAPPAAAAPPNGGEPPEPLERAEIPPGREYEDT